MSCLIQGPHFLYFFRDYFPDMERFQHQGRVSEAQDHGIEPVILRVGDPCEDIAVFVHSQSVAEIIFALTLASGEIFRVRSTVFSAAMSHEVKSLYE